MHKTIFAILGVILSAVYSASGAEVVKVLAPGSRDWNNSFTEIGRQQGFFADNGLDVEIAYAGDEETLNKKVISGDVDIGMAAVFPDVLASWLKGAPIKIISPQATGAPDIFWFAKIAGPVGSMRDLRGQPVGYAGPGSLSHLVLDTLLRDVGIDDANLVATGAPDSGIPLVLGAQLAASWGGPAAAAKDLLAGEIRMIGRGDDSPHIRNMTMRVNIANASFLDKRRGAALKFLRAYKKSVDWAYGNPSAIEAYAKLSNVPAEIAKYVVRKFSSKVTNQIDEMRGEDRSLAQASTLKLIPKPLSHDDIKNIYDLVLNDGP